MANRASTTEEQARLKIKHLEKDLEEKVPQVAKTERQNNVLQNEIAAGLKAKADLTVSPLYVLSMNAACNLCCSSSDNSNL
jgi:RNA-splicing ligase RtcB